MKRKKVKIIWKVIGLPIVRGRESGDSSRRYTRDKTGE